MNEQKQPMQAEREYGPLETAAPVVLNPNAPAAPASALAGSGFWRRLWALVHKEVRQLLRDPGNLGVGMGLPIILILIKTATAAAKYQNTFITLFCDPISAVMIGPAWSADRLLAPAKNKELSE